MDVCMYVCMYAQSENALEKNNLLFLENTYILDEN